ncbi:hypothetical protein P175DRAFT_0558021 [Aspergillus ochraceoroseus IBT 24754]|uniref:Uncharacterized protein n=1 Tax=Aspergillus ochraceoroseus IBT 24754 TaxID=1392256 RepID=A0A2T5LU51_9EURO|nr:uncharacterized protein P175DRAFT_0558021 [Aspergillus ochraceoroseus IBT 24754]PTU19812.1 hypothetical protein P175DRAFT_0558021 [Aspergillus ochraceoroseus IBT 24754]
MLSSLETFTAMAYPQTMVIPIRGKHSKRGRQILKLFLEGRDVHEPLSEVRPPILFEAVEDEYMTTWLLDHGADPI